MGDEFLVSFYGIDASSDADQMATVLLEKVRSLNAINGKPISISASIGVSTTHQPQNTAINGMIKRSDQLMSKAKHSGKNRFCSEEFYSGR